MGKTLGFEPIDNVGRLFRKQQEKGAFDGGQLVVRRHGESILDVAVGIARRGSETLDNIPAEVKTDTPFPVYSTGKPFAAIVIALLEEKGLLDLNAPISDIIPEFGVNGKENITTLDVLTHRAGIVLPALSNEYKLADRSFVFNYIIDSAPSYPRGTFAYMPTEFGVILCEITKRITGMTIADYFYKAFARPLDLPNLQYGLSNRHIEEVAYSYWLGKKKVMIGGANVAEHFEEINNAPSLFESINPSFSMISDAMSLARFYEFLVNKGVSAEGKALISEKILLRYTTESLFGWNRSIKSFMAVSRGFQTGMILPTAYGWWNTKGCFGHGGAFSSIAFGDYQTGLSVAVTTNGNRGLWDFSKRFIPLMHQLRQIYLKR